MPPHNRSRALRYLTLLTCLALQAGAAPVARADEPPSRPAVDSPELAPLGRYAVGVRTLTLVEHEAVDVVAPGKDRPVVVDVWYPATVPAHSHSHPETYSASLQSEPPNPKPPVHFTMPGVAVRDAPAQPGPYPLVVVSHGRSNVTIALSWLTENLASKGYVVAAIRHEDLARTNPAEIPEMLLRRPLDIAFVARTLQASLAHEGLIDPARTALIGYSMGGYGVLCAAGASLDPQSAALKLIPGARMAPYASGGSEQKLLRVDNLKAVVAIAPWGGSVAVWGSTGLAGISAPLLLIAGDHDHSVDYGSGARGILEAATGAHRYLLTYKGAGHALGFGPAPAEMRHGVWDISWFEDPVWRKERIIGINLHVITAFLDRFVKGDESRAAYLDVPEPDSSAGRWDAPPGTAFDALSPGTAGITLWKGFQRDYAEGLELLQRAPNLPAQP
jgi:predicted dienelactone hydrolase